jgi:hypothetical protein
MAILKPRGQLAASRKSNRCKVANVAITKKSDAKKGMSPPFLALEPSDRLNGVEKQRPHRLEEGDEVG